MELADTGSETLGHRLSETLCFLMVRAGAAERLAGFAFCAGGGTPALTCLSRSRTITRIHSGRTDSPLRKSS